MNFLVGLSQYSFVECLKSCFGMQHCLVIYSNLSILSPCFSRFVFGSCYWQSSSGSFHILWFVDISLNLHSQDCFTLPIHHGIKGCSHLLLSLGILLMSFCSLPSDHYSSTLIQFLSTSLRSSILETFSPAVLWDSSLEFIHYYCIHHWVSSWSYQVYLVMKQFLFKMFLAYIFSLFRITFAVAGW